MRVITPGTLIDEKFMDPYENNYLLAISLGAAKIDRDAGMAPGQSAVSADGRSSDSGLFGLAWLDLSTGDFYTQTANAASLASALARIGAREIVMKRNEDTLLHQNVVGMFDQQRHLITYHRTDDEYVPITEWTSILEAAVPPEVQVKFTPEEVTAASLLLSYVKEQLQGAGIKLQPPVQRQDNETMRIDKNSLRGLEILETSREGVGGGKGSLLHSVRRTVTKGGTRLLKIWIGANARFHIVLFDRSLSIKPPYILVDSSGCRLLIFG